MAAGIPFAKGPDTRRFGGGRAPRVTLPSGERVTLSSLAREATYEAVQVLRECVNDKTEDLATRCRAAGYLLSLGWGAAPKEATLRLVPDNRTLAQMSTAELIAHWMEMRGSQPATTPIVIDADDKAAD